MTIRVPAALASVVAVGLLLAACDPGSYIRRNNTETLEAGFMKHSTDVAPPPPTFCYNTLGHTDCYADPQPGNGERLVESYPPRNTLPEPVIR